MSPDGRHVAFLGISVGGPDAAAAVVTLDSPDARPLPGKLGALGRPCWSADGADSRFAVGVRSGGIALRAAPCSGSARRPPRARTPGHGTSRGDDHVFRRGGRGPRRLYSVGGGGEAVAPHGFDEARGERTHHWPQFLPDGRHLLLRVASRDAAHHGPARDLPGVEPATGDGSGPRGARASSMSPPGTTPLRPGRRFLVQALRSTRSWPGTKGEAVPIASSVAAFGLAPPDFGWFSASSNGRVAWLSEPGQRELRLEWVENRTGKRLGTLGRVGEIRPDCSLPGRQTRRGRDRRTAQAGGGTSG